MRVVQSEPMRLRFGRYAFDSDLRELSQNGKRVPLTPKAFALLEALIEAAPEPLSRERLAQILWPQTFVEPGNLHNLVAEVRAALGDDERRIIRTVHKFGYGFEAAGATEARTYFVVAIGRDEIPLRSGENLIGRDPADTVVIDAPEVSRHHARLTVDGDRVTIEDLGSKNGTFVGTERIARVTEVKPGDTIVIGRTRINLRAARRVPTTKTAT